MVRVTLLMLIGGAMTAGAVSAQAYPDKPIRLVVGSAPGGGTDFAARVTNARFSELLGKQVVIDNRGGAGGLVASDLVTHATADGYTLLQMASNLVILPSLHRKLPETKERLLTDGMEPAGGTPNDFTEQVRQDLRKWNAVVKQAGIKPN